MLVLGRISVANTEVVLWSVVGGVGADGGVNVVFKVCPKCKQWAMREFDNGVGAAIGPMV